MLKNTQIKSDHLKWSLKYTSTFIAIKFCNYFLKKSGISIFVKPEPI